METSEVYCVKGVLREGVKATGFLPGLNKRAVTGTVLRTPDQMGREPEE